MFKNKKKRKEKYPQQTKKHWIYNSLQEFQYIIQCAMWIWTQPIMRLRVYEFHSSVVGKRWFTNKIFAFIIFSFKRVL